MSYYVLEVEKINLIRNADGNKELGTTVTYFFAMKKGCKVPIGRPFQTPEEAEQHIVAIEEKRINEQLIDRNALSDIDAGENLWVRKVNGKEIGEKLNTLDEVFDSAEKAIADLEKKEEDKKGDLIEEEKDKEMDNKNEIKSTSTKKAGIGRR